MNRSKFLIPGFATLGSGLLLGITLILGVKSVLPDAATSLPQGVGAYYYPWYSLERWERDREVMGSPLLGPYESDDIETIEQHINWARDSGINYFIYSWLGSDKNMYEMERYYSNRLIDVASKKNFKLMPLYETSLALFQPPDLIDFDASYSNAVATGDRFVEDMVFYAENSATNKSTFAQGNCPTIALYLVRNFVNHRKYFKILNDSLSDRGLCLNLVADLVFWGSPDRPFQYNDDDYEQQWKWISENFSGIFGYNYYTDDEVIYPGGKDFSTRYLSAKKKAQELWSRRAARFGLQYVFSVQPGYDDRPLRGLTRPYIEASSGFYLRDWERVSSAKYKGCSVHITSFNEWYEGTSIEPTVGVEYSLLDTTKSMTNKFNKLNSCTQ